MSEKTEAKRDGASLQKNSGRGKNQKGDAVLGEWLVDYKEAKRSFTVNHKVWAKVCTDSFRHGKEPVIKLILGEGNNKVRLSIKEWRVEDFV